MGKRLDKMTGTLKRFVFVVWSKVMVTSSSLLVDLVTKKLRRRKTSFRRPNGPPKSSVNSGN